MRYALFALLAAFILFSGCVTESQLFPEKEKITAYKELDTDGNGVADAWSYSFATVPVGNANVTVTRSMLVRELNQSGIAKYQAQIVLTIDNSNPQAALSDLTLTERIPTDLTTSQADLSFQTNYTRLAGQQPLVYEWRITGLGSKANTSISYTALSSRRIDKSWVESNMLTPNVAASISTLTNYPAVAFSLSLLQGILGALTPIISFYPAIAVTASLVLIILYAFYGLLLLIYGTIFAIKDRKNLRDTIYDVAGAGEKDNRTYLIVGAVLVAIGLASAYLLPSAAQAPQASADFGSLIKDYVADPIKAFGSLLLMLGLLALFFVAEDAVKGLVLGKRYYEAIRKPAQLEEAVRESGVMEHTEHLRDEVSATLQKAEALTASGFDFNDEISVLEAIIGGIDKAEERAMKHELDDARGLLVEARKKYDAARPSLLKKVEKASKLSAELASLYTAKSDCEALLIEAERQGSNVGEAKKKLADIDVDASVDFAKKLASDGKLDQIEKEIGPAKRSLETLRSSLSTLAKAKKRVKIGSVNKQKLDAVLKGLVSSRKIEAAAIVRRDGLMVTSNLPSDVDKDVIAAMSARMMDRAEMVSSELKRGDVKYVVADGSLGKIIAMDVSGAAVLICLIKPKDDIGFAILAMETAARNIADLFGVG
ncbi:MAG: roadblock/LC7 domain-containing protein [Candidatus Micrarchaeia archaeon]|jgi:hypothetical protein